jgi:CRISPR-associated protein Cmr2
MTKYVLIFSLGPVQSFITEARRTQDLWAGSHMLVEVARAAIRAAGGELVYPAAAVLEEADVPNKFVTFVDDPRAAARNAREEVEKRWQDLADAALGKLLDNDDTELRAIWEYQRDHHLEFYWAAAQLMNDDYISAYQKAAQALDARKRTRNFQQVKEDGLKDSLSGMRSALRPSSPPHRRKEARAHMYWEQVRKNQHLRPNLKEGERLDTIGAMKRFAEDKLFPSVSTVASAPFASACHRAGLLDGLRQAIRSFNQQMGYEFFYKVGNWGRGFEYDGDLLYEETHARGRLKASYGSADPAEVVVALKQLYQQARDNGIRPVRPTPYYAIMAMDGDRMGKHISACRTKEEHTELSQQLADFAGEVKGIQETTGIVEEHGGYLVYAGGDDVLAFFPLECALRGTATLAEAYRKRFTDFKQLGPDGKSLPFTVSAGITIAHHLHPLDAVLEEARRAEKLAKNRYDRNALCVSVLKRSGEAIRVGSKWQINGSRVVDLIDGVVDDLRQERLATQFVYELYDQVSALGTIEEDMLSPLLKRLLNRHQDQKTEELKTKVEDLTIWLSSFAQAQVKVEDGAAMELSRWLLLAQFLAQGGSE